MQCFFHCNSHMKDSFYWDLVLDELWESAWFIEDETDRRLFLGMIQSALNNVAEQLDNPED